MEETIEIEKKKKVNKLKLNRFPHAGRRKEGSGYVPKGNYQAAVFADSGFLTTGTEPVLDAQLRVWRGLNRIWRERMIARGGI